MATRNGEPRRVEVVPGGPVLIEGPVEVELADGSTACSDRSVVALCTCRRTRRPPWCDTSHRAHREPSVVPAGTTR
ncbi:CDGSH iron-sulfur domain-containing protein [Embleya sp. NBC_00896]|uniref:CDGSH iron-sulfur domain-containing protein n=1 Tax=Embleya sp. NBC_00896 TaxID=2975961 RepID=UPI002F90CC3D|nr:CDGSH iron-sulfur domain-containing protein [Embleya sp. NBC_00896]